MAFLVKARKDELVTLSEELGIECSSRVTKLELIKKIKESADYEEETVSGLLECIQQEKLTERQEKLAEQERLDRIETERQQFELERIRLQSSREVGGSTPGQSENSLRKSSQDMKHLMPKFNIEETDISLYLALFERQAKTAQIEDEDLASQLLAILPIEIGQIILRESEENARDYKFIKELLLGRFRLSPEAFRQKFMQHVRKPNIRFKDYVYELRNYLEGWIGGLEIKTFEDLKNLMLADQLKRRASPEMRDHFLDKWESWNSPLELADHLDSYENSKKTFKKLNFPTRNAYLDRKLGESRTGVETKDRSKNVERVQPTGNESRFDRNREFERKREIRCYKCKKVGHIKPNCPERNLHDTEVVNQFNLSKEAEECMAPFMSKALVNGYELDILRDSGASFDLISNSYVPPENLLREHVWIRQPLNPEAKCLPVAKVEIKGEFGKITTKAGVVASSLDPGFYILSNRTAKMIEDLSGKVNRSEVICAITRAQERKRLRENMNAKIKENDINPSVLTEQFEPSGSEEMIQVIDPPIPCLQKELLEISKQQLIEEQKKCSSLIPLIEKARSKLSEAGKSEYFLKEGLLLKRQQNHRGEIINLIVIPRVFREKIMKMCHEGFSAHVGTTKSKDRLSKNFFWPGCYRDLENFVRSCDACQRVGHGRDKKKAPLKLVPIIKEVFSRINIDACGPLPKSESGKRYLITAICMSSKYPEAIPVIDISSISVTDALLEIFSRIGFPREVQCDNGTSFTSNLTSEFFERLGIKVSHSSIAHPQSNPVERFHRTLKRLLRTLCIEAASEWERHLPAALFALRTVVHESVGFSPAELVHGRNLRTPENLLFEHWVEPPDDGSLVTEHVYTILNRLRRSQDLAAERLAELQEKRKLWYDKNAVKREFKIGDRVLMFATSRPNKLSAQWTGPGIVEKKISDTNYLVKLGEQTERSRVYHINMLKPYFRRPEAINLIVEENVDEENSDSDWDIPCIEDDPNIFDFSEVSRASQLERRLTKDQIEQFRSLLNRYSKMFASTPGVTDVVTHDIQLISSKPVRCGPYKTSRRQNEILKDEIEKMLRLGVVEIGESDYCSPMILVEVPGKDPRPCIDYRRLNEVIRTEFFPLPQLEERVERVAAAPFITLLDLSKGYWQIPLSKRAQRYAAFVTSFGSYFPLRMPFGLKNAPYFFSKLMANLLKGCEDFAVPYIDDVAIYSSDWESHLKHLEITLKRIENANLTLKPSKCKFAQSKVQYLGHMVGSGERSPSEAKIQSIANFPRPETKTNVRAFLGLTGYYSRYISRYSEIAAPLTDRLKGKDKKGKINWDENCDKSFNLLKGELMKSPVLRAPDFNKPFIVQTDASDIGMGIVLAQEFGTEEHPILYLSKKFTKAERNYSTIERECAAIIYAIKKLHYYLDGTKFKIVSDHRPLTWLKNNAGSNPRLLRWSLALQPFAYEISHKAGHLNANADALSREIT